MCEKDKRIIDLFNKLKNYSSSSSIYCYIDALNALEQNDVINYTPECRGLAHKILRWEINYDEKTQKYFPLRPILFSTKLDEPIHNLLKKFFLDDEINLLFTLSKSSEIDSVILARINDLLLCYLPGTSNTVLRKSKLAFVNQAIKHYILSSNQESENYGVPELYRASRLYTYYRISQSDVLVLLEEAITQRLRREEPLHLDKLRLYECLYEMGSDSNIKFVEKEILAFLCENYPTPKTHNEILGKYYEVAIKIFSDDKIQIAKYQGEMIDSLLWFANFYAEKGNYPKAFSCIIKAEAILKKSTISKENKNNLKIIFQEKKKKFNRLPSNMTFQRLSMSTAINDDSIKSKIENTSLCEVFGILAFEIHSLDYRLYLTQEGFLLQTVTLLVPGENEDLLNDSPPMFINYSSSELQQICILHRTNKEIIGRKISHFLSIVNDHLNKEKTFHQKNTEFAEQMQYKHIAQERESIILDSIQFALSGNMSVALHLIIPQLEAHIRGEMRRNEISIDKFTNENNTELDSLSQIFQNDGAVDVLIKNYGHDICCDLYFCLLDKQWGNYRNKVCHGLMDAQAFRTGESYYVWALCLYIILKNMLFPSTTE